MNFSQFIRQIDPKFLKNMNIFPEITKIIENLTVSKHSLVLKSTSIQALLALNITNSSCDYKYYQT